LQTNKNRTAGVYWNGNSLSLNVLYCQLHYRQENNMMILEKSDRNVWSVFIIFSIFAILFRSM